VFGIDDAFYQESQQMKSNMLRMIHVKEFSEEAQKGVEPSLTLVIPDIICEQCQHCADLDICRDQIINQQGEGIDNWQC